MFNISYTFFFAEERAPFARIHVTLVCCESLQRNDTNPKTAACILVFVTLHDATAASCVYHSEAAIARVKDNAHFEDHVRSEHLDICANF